MGDAKTIIEGRDAAFAALEEAIKTVRQSPPAGSGSLRAVAFAARDYVKAFDAWDRLLNREETEQGGVPRAKPL
jgi:hypothetical protein